MEEPDPAPFIKKLKQIPAQELVNFIIKKLNVRNSIHQDYDYKTKVSGPKIVNGFSEDSWYVYARDFYTNYEVVENEYKELCKKHYQTYDERLKSIDDRCQEYCDKIVFAETYDEALKIIKEFTKF